MVQGPQGGDRGEGDARLLRAQEEERVARVAEGEHGQDPEVAGEPRLERAAGRERGGRWGRGPPLLAHAEDEGGHGERAGHGGEGEDDPQVARRDERERGEDRSHHRPRVVHRPLEAEGPAPVLPRHDRGEERVARRAADPLSDAIGEAHREDVGGGRGEGDERPRERGERVPRDHERLAPGPAVGQAARGDLEGRRHRLGDALDDAEEGGARPKRAGEERGDERVDHLAARVGEEADEAERADRAGERRAHGPILRPCDAVHARRAGVRCYASGVPGGSMSTPRRGFLKTLAAAPLAPAALGVAAPSASSREAAAQALAESVVRELGAELDAAERDAVGKRVARGLEQAARLREAARLTNADEPVNRFEARPPAPGRPGGRR